ncbi:MAG: hypothetical protein AAF614_37840 [Chloroflexota bacterium]
MLSVSRVNTFRLVVALSTIVIALTPYLDLGLTVAHACVNGGGASSHGGC